MTYVGQFARTQPDHPALVMVGSGERRTYRELDERSTRLARYWWDHGLRRGDHVAALLHNSPEYHEVAWAAMRSGLYLTPVNWHLTTPEVAYILEDCGARSLVATAALAHVVAPLRVELPLMAGGTAGWPSYEDALAASSSVPFAEEPEGAAMYYSSGTTGRPKGILFPLPDRRVDELNPQTAANRAGYSPETRYLSPAPHYHAAPLASCLLVQRFGGTVYEMERFDPAAFLAAVEQHRIDRTQMVPTMFVRLLKLPDHVREQADVSSLRNVLHAAAPCPVEVKRRMIEWWGPILDEFYAGSENCGNTWITSEEWLAHPGSVGRGAGCTIHICDDAGEELPVGEVGQVWFEAAHADFSYHNDPERTAEARHPRGWHTMGDIGRLDDDGYLYLSDRKAFMIISGGVNIYPQEAEDVLVLHPAVADVAVFGIPDEEMGEQVKAVVQPADPAAAGPELEAELLAFCRERLAGYKCPRSVDFEAELPRHETGKLYKRLLRDRYWGDHDTRIV